MPNVKHLLSYACDKSCSYCINELLAHKERQTKDLAKRERVYRQVATRPEYSQIMLSGGEPVVHSQFEDCLRLAAKHFEEVSVLTAHVSSLSSEAIGALATDVMYSVHTEYLEGFETLRVETPAPVYASMVYDAYLKVRNMIGGRSPGAALEERGFAGLTVRRLYPGGEPIDMNLIEADQQETSEGFSWRVYERERCQGQGSTLILPDLSLSSQKSFVPDLEPA